MSSIYKIRDLIGSVALAIFVRKGESSDPGNTGVQHKLAFDAVNYFLSKIVPGLMGFFSVLVFVRLVGYEQYGRYAVVFAIAMSAASGTAGWMSQGILRFKIWSQTASDKGGFLRAAIGGTLISVLMGLCFLGVLVGFIISQRGMAQAISLFLFASILVYTVTLAWFQASLRSNRVLAFEVMRSIAGFIIPVILMLLTRSKAYTVLLLGIALGYLLPMIRPVFLQTTVFMRLLWQRHKYLSQREWEMLIKLWHFGWPVAFWLLCQQGLLVFDRIFIQKFSGYSSAGVYSSMYDIVVRSFSLLFMPVTLAVHPLVMNHWDAGNPQAALAAIRSGIKYQVIMFLPVALVLLIFAPWVSHIILGKATSATASTVFPLALGGFLWQVCMLAHKPLEILCQTKRMLAGMILALAVNIVGNWLLIPRFGYLASAYLTIGSSATYLVFLLAVTPINKFRIMIKVDQTNQASHDYSPEDRVITT